MPESGANLLVEIDATKVGDKVNHFRKPQPIMIEDVPDEVERHDKEERSQPDIDINEIAVTFHLNQMVENTGKFSTYLRHHDNRFREKSDGTQDEKPRSTRRRKKRSKNRRGTSSQPDLDKWSGSQSPSLSNSLIAKNRHGASIDVEHLTLDQYSTD